MKKETMIEKVSNAKFGKHTLGQLYPSEEYDYFVYIYSHSSFRPLSVYRNNHILAKGIDNSETIPTPFAYDKKYIFSAFYHKCVNYFEVYIVKKYI